MMQQLQEYDHERSKKTFSIVFVKCDEKRKTGGQIVTLHDVQKCGLPYHCLDNEMIGVVQPGGRPVAVHTKLALMFNDQQVTP